MPPQLVADVFRGKTSYSFGLSFTKPALERPELSAMVLNVIGTWSRIDMHINQMASLFLSADVHVVFKMLNSIESISARRTAIRTAAQHMLSDGDYRIFSAALKTTKSSELRRYVFAHHVWATSKEFPNELLLIDPKTANILAAAEAEYDITRDPKGSVNKKPFSNMECIYIYTEKDLQEEIDRANRAFMVVRELTILMSNLSNQRGDSIRESLLADPLIERAFRKASS